MASRNPLHFGSTASEGGVSIPIPPHPSAASQSPDSAPSAAAAFAQASRLRCHARTLFIAGLLLGAVLAGLSVQDFLPRVRDVVTVGVPLPFPLPLFFRNLTLPETGPWSYTHVPDTGRGPAAWGALRDPATGALVYPHCADPGQAPIALSSAGAAPRGSLQLRRTAAGARNFTMAPRVDFHPGFEFRVRGAGAPHPVWVVDGAEFEFADFHYHSPAEHMLDGVQHPLELHFVFERAGAEPPEVAVMGILFPWAPNGPDNPFVTSFWNNICASFAAGGRGQPAAP